MKKKLLIVIASVFLLLLLGIGGVIFWFFQVQKPVNPASAQVISFVIPKGQSVQKIAERLVQSELIRNAQVFRFIVWKEKLGPKIQAGSFQLNKAMSTLDIAKRLTMGTDDLWVTIPEGKRSEEVAELFAEFTEFDADEFLKLAKDEEGYLFPDTYLFPVQASAATVHTSLRQNFDKVIVKNNIEERAEKEGKTLKDIVILASLLEREAQSVADMKMVAGILYNRIESGMPLQVDATMQYAKGYDEKTKNWWPPALSADKEIDSPYNTYKVTGLPPGPIANPGLKALEAAVSPTESDYVFYITDNNGQMHYAKTYDEHLENVNKYLR